MLQHSWTKSCDPIDHQVFLGLLCNMDIPFSDALKDLSIHNASSKRSLCDSE